MGRSEGFPARSVTGTSGACPGEVELPAGKTSGGGTPLSRLLFYASPYRRKIEVAGVYSVLNKLFDLAPPLLIGAAVDVVVTQEASFVSKLGVTGAETQLWLHQSARALPRR